MRMHHLGWAIVAAGTCFALGCEKPADNSAPTASASASGAAPSASVAATPPKPRPQFARHGGLASGLFHAAHDLPDLTDAEQQSMAKIEGDLKSDDEGIRTAMKAFRADLVAGVQAGKLDTAKMTADDAVIDKAIADHQAKEAAALASLHSLLTPAQRAALVASVRAKQAEREAKMGQWMNKDADGGAPDWGKHRLDKLTADLGLDAGQQKQVAAILTKGTEAPDGKTMQSRMDERKARSEALLTAFAADAMDTKKLDLAIMPGKSPHEPMDHMVAFYTKLLPILHPDQRQKLGQSLDRPFGGHMGGPGGDHDHGDRSPADDMTFPFSEPMEHSGGEEPSSPK